MLVIIQAAAVESFTLSPADYQPQRRPQRICHGHASTDTHTIIDTSTCYKNVSADLRPTLHEARLKTTLHDKPAKKTQHRYSSPYL